MQATDPATGQTVAEPVTDVIITPTDTEFTDTVVLTRDGTSATITSTQHHRFYDVTRHAWVDAATLKHGDDLRAPNGTLVTILTVHNYHHPQTTYNLTIQTLHTYYVLAGDTPVLVHNCGGIPGPRVTQEGLNHSFDRHAAQWFGRSVTRADKMGQWSGIVTRAAGSSKVVPWSSGSTMTNAYLARIEGKWFAAQFHAGTGKLVTAFVPNNSQVGAMLKLLGTS